MTLEANPSALSGQPVVDYSEEGREFLHHVLNRIPDGSIGSSFPHEQVIGTDAKQFGELQKNVDRAAALAALDLIHVLMPDIQPESEFLLGKPHPVAFFLDPLSEIHLVKIHVLSFPQSRRRHRLRTKRTGLRFLLAEQKEKAPSKSNPGTGYGYPLF